MSHSLARAPLFLVVLRAALAPIVIWLALRFPDPIGFGGCLTAAFLSDVFDGILARRLNVATVALRRLDSAADTLFYLATMFAAWHLYPEVVAEHAVALIVLASLEVVRYGVDIVKFRREASYHMWSSKLWGLSLFAGFCALLVFGHTGVLVALPIYIGIAADLEGLAISLALPEWRTDVPSLLHAFRILEIRRR